MKKLNVDEVVSFVIDGKLDVKASGPFTHQEWQVYSFSCLVLVDMIVYVIGDKST